MRLADIATDALVNANRVAKRKPTVIEVLFAFSFVTGLLLQRGGRAFRTSGGDWEIDRATANGLWPDLLEGLSVYLPFAVDYAGHVVPTREQFFHAILPDFLAISADIRLIRPPSPGSLLQVLADRLGEDWIDSSASEQTFMLTVAQDIFARMK